MLQLAIYIVFGMLIYRPPLLLLMLYQMKVAFPANSSLTCVVVYMFGAELSPVKMDVCEISKILQILSF